LAHIVKFTTVDGNLAMVAKTNAIFLLQSLKTHLADIGLSRFTVVK